MKEGAFLCFVFSQKKSCKKLLVYVTKLTSFKMETFPIFNPGGNTSIYLFVRCSGPQIERPESGRRQIWTLFPLYAWQPPNPNHLSLKVKAQPISDPFKLPASDFYHLLSYSLDANWKWLTCIAGLAYGAFDFQPKKRGLCARRDATNRDDAEEKLLA